jgi:CRP-like cAMP-binding protein
VRLTVVSKTGKEAMIGILGEGNFFGEGSLAGQVLRMGSADALADCELLQIDKKAMMGALHREHAFSDMFVAYFAGAEHPLRRRRSTNCLIPVRSDWPASFYCSRISARRVFRKPWSPKSVRRP